MKRLLYITILLGVVLISAVSSFKWRQISDVVTTLTEINYLHGITGKPLTRSSADSIYNQIANNINPHDSVYYKDESDAKYAPLINANLTNPTVTTQVTGDNSTKAASTAFVSNTVRQVFPDQGKTYSFPYNNTGNTTENVIITDTIPANSIGVNGSFHIMFRFSATLNTNAKHIRIKFNGTTIAGILSNSASNNYGSLINILTNKGSHTAHTGGSITSATGQTFGVGTVPFVSYTTEYSSSQEIIVSVTEQVAVGTDYIRLESLQIEAHP